MYRTIAVLTLSFISVLYAQSETGEVSPVQQALDMMKEIAQQDYQDRRYDRVIEFLQEAKRYDRKNAEIFYLLGACEKQNDHIINGPEADTPPVYGSVSKTSSYFEKCIKISPSLSDLSFLGTYEYGIIFMDPYSKLTSLWGDLAFMHMLAGNYSKARQVFMRGRRRGGFQDPILEYNRNMLTSCESNAILFTNGDNDTFPAWYLQVVEGFRTDVTVVNLSLLNTKWFMRFIRDSRPEDLCFNHLNDEWIDSTRAMKWESRSMTLPENHEQQITWVVQPTLQNRGIRVQDLAVLEIIDGNRWEYPIYFANTVAPVNVLGLNDNLVFQGGVLQIVPERAFWIDADQMLRNLSAKYTYDALDWHYFKSEAFPYTRLYSNYIAGFLQLGLHYSQQDDLEGLQNALEEMKRILPEEKVTYHEGFTPVIENLQKALEGDQIK